MLHARSRAWPRDCRDRHRLPTNPLALQELWGLPTTVTNMSSHLSMQNTDDMFHARSRAWPRDCRERHIVLAYPLALQELWGLQEPGRQKGNFEKGLVSVHFNSFVSICRSTRLGGSARPVLCRRVLGEREDTNVGKVDFTRRRARWWLFWRTIAIGLTKRLLLPASSFSEPLAVPWGLMLSLFRRLRPTGRTLSIGFLPTSPSLSLSSCVGRRSQPTEKLPYTQVCFWQNPVVYDLWKEFFDMSNDDIHFQHRVYR